MTIKDFRFDGSKKLKVKDMPTDAGDSKGKKSELVKQTQANLLRASELQERLYAAGREGLVIAIQARDAAGKDSLIKKVFSGLNPAALEVHSFKSPSSTELSHDYLWRINAALPPRGKIGVFNRSQYEDVLVVESLALGIDRLKGYILAALVKVLAEDGIQVRGIYERSDAKVRELEGLPREKGFLSAPFDTKKQITENGVRYIVDVENGQKTGFFLDQKDNRRAIHRLCGGAKVLDCFTHTGSFALNAAVAGASSVLAVDASDLAVAQAQENARLNGVETKVSFLCRDVFALLPELLDQGEQYDVVILDPPAFTKSRNSIKAAARGYREINLRGMKLVRNGGYLVTCSCSHFMDPELFKKTIAEAARDAHRRLRQVEFRTQAPDHPILWASDESYYLKFYIFQVVEEM